MLCSAWQTRDENLGVGGGKERESIRERERERKMANWPENDGKLRHGGGSLRYVGPLTAAGGVKHL